jgi:L-aspartate oxidase
MTARAGVLRDASGLDEEAIALVRLEDEAGWLPADDGSWELRNLVAVARLLVAAARARAESRGTHTRLDHPQSSDAFLGRFVHLGHHAPRLVPLPAQVPA